MSLHAKQIRVLHIIGDSRFGGIAQIVVGLSRVARAEGWQADVLATDPAVQEYFRQAGMGVVDLDVIRHPIRPWWDLIGLIRLRAYLRRAPYLIVHTHTSKAGFVGRLAAWWAGVPIILHTLHGFAFHERSPRLALRFYTLLERIASHGCDRIVSVSEFHRRWAIALGICRPPKIAAIPNGVPPVEVSPSFNAGEIRERLGICRDDLLIFTSSRLAADKGLDDLVKAAAKLSRREFRFRIAIAGDGPIRELLETAIAARDISDKVTLLGFRQDVAELLCASDLVIFPSLREGLSMSLLEAMAAGKPIIATSIGSVQEVASQGQVLHLVPPADSKALADAIQALAYDAAYTDRLAINARKLFAARYTESRMLNDYKCLYHELLRLKAPSAAAMQSGSSRHVSSQPHREHGAAAVRAAHAGDLADIVDIHQKAFSDFFLTRLGRDFLCQYYQLVLGYQSGIVLASESGGAIQGFVCGFLDPPEFYRSMWRNKRAFMLPALSALLRNPALTNKMLSGIRRIQTSTWNAQPQTCELSSIAVAPEASGNGLGMSLLQAFLSRSWSMNAGRVSLTTDAENNEAANALYRDAGFSVARRFLQRRGRWMNEYVIERAAASCEEDRQ